MPMVFWLEASAPETGELAYLNHDDGTVYFGSDNNNRLSMSHIEPPDVNQQIDYLSHDRHCRESQVVPQSAHYAHGIHSIHVTRYVRIMLFSLHCVCPFTGVNLIRSGIVRKYTSQYTAFYNLNTCSVTMTVSITTWSSSMVTRLPSRVHAIIAGSGSDTEKVCICLTFYRCHTRC